MRNLIYIYILSFVLWSCQTWPIKSTESSFDYYVRETPHYDFDNLNKVDRMWRELSNDTLIYTAYYRGAYCDIPQKEDMSIKIKNDTIFFNFGLENVDPDCERTVGVAGIMVDFILNKKKYSDYKGLKISCFIRG